MMLTRARFVQGSAAFFAVVAGTTPTVPSTRGLSRDQMREDLDFLLATMREVAAAPYRYADQATFESRTWQLRARLPDRCGVEHFYVELARLFATLNDVHCGTSPAFYADYLTAGGLLLPLDLAFRADRVFVADDFGEKASIAPWTELLALEGWSAAELRRRSAALVGAQTAPLKEALAPYRISLYCEMGPRTEYSVVLGPSARPRHVRVAAQTRAVVEARKVRADPRLGRPYSFQILEPSGVGYLDYRRCEGVDQFVRLLDDAWAHMRRRRSAGLIVDLRNNGGGDSSVSEQLLRRLAHGAFTQEGVVTERVSDKIKREYGRDRYVAVYGEEAWRARDGSLLDVAPSMVKPYDDHRALRLPVVFLVGVRTISAGMECAAAASAFRIAQLVGEPTGQPATSTSEIYRTSTPNSGIEAFFPTKIIRSPEPTSDEIGVRPDVVVSSSVTDLAHAKDVPLERSLQMILGA